ncbi:MAG: DUF3793 family protein [Lachnospiraceae bacterium]|nr:DUF3793 family protein [Lachnospiraceae bacterium]
MLNNALIEYCAPTLAGIKTGNLFSVKDNSKEDSNEIYSEIRKLNTTLTKLGLRVIPIKRNGKKTLVYLYRPDRLKTDLKDPVAIEILSEKGYSCANSDRCLVELIRHLTTDENFPHEIGLFLSYPPSDVKAFMGSPCAGVKCTGSWKAYSNESEAKKTFERYKKCTDLYTHEQKSGKPLDALIFDANRKLRFAI